MSTDTPPPAATTEDRTVAIVAYLTIIGFIVALIMHGNKKTALGSYHLRQCLGLVITGFVVGAVAVIPLLGWLIAIISMPVFLVFWVMGLISAVNGQQKPIPLVGEKYQQWFASTFN